MECGGLTQPFCHTGAEQRQGGVKPPHSMPAAARPPGLLNAGSLEESAVVGRSQ